jgi:hypothetical protein
MSWLVKRPAARVAALGVAVVLSSVGATASAQPAAPPSVKIITPGKCGCGIVDPQTSTVKVVVQVTNFKLSATHFGKAPVAGEGHLLFSLDRGKFDHPAYSGANGRLAAKVGLEGKYSLSAKTTMVYKDIPEGKHTIVVYLARNDHKRLGPSAQITFPVQ